MQDKGILCIDLLEKICYKYDRMKKERGTEKAHRKYGPNHDYTIPVSVTVPESLLKALDKEREQRYASRSGVIREALEKLLLKDAS